MAGIIDDRDVSPIAVPVKAPTIFTIGDVVIKSDPPGVTVEDSTITIPTSGFDWRTYINTGFVNPTTIPSSTDTTKAVQEQFDAIQASKPEPKRNWLPLLAIGGIAFIVFWRLK